MKKFVIIGNSAAGIAAIEAIRSKDKDSKITVISDEDYLAYCRCVLSYYLAGHTSEPKIIYRQQEFYKDNRVELILGKKVTRVEPAKNRIVLEDNTKLDYDSLLIAAGSSSKIPDIKGARKRGAFGFRTIKDTKEIMGILPVTKSAIILGGGLVGLKAAYALKKRGLDVKVIVKSKQILSQALDFDAANLLQKKFEENGIELILEQDAAEIIGNGDVKAVKLDSGKVIAASLVIIAKGVHPNISIIKDSDVKTNIGIVCDKHLQTNVPNIFTAGDCAETFELITGQYTINALWPVAVEQGRIAGFNMAASPTDYQGSLNMNSLEFFSTPTVSLGMFRPKDTQGLEEIKITNPDNCIYKKLILKDNFLVGACFVGDIKNSGLFLRLIREKINVMPFKDKLLDTNFGYPEIMDFLKDKEKVYV